MNSNERLIRLTPDNLEGFVYLNSIYREAIPVNERKSEDDLKKLILREDYLVYLLMRYEEVSAFAILYRSIPEKIALLEYMAVVRSHRNGGIGGRILSRLFTAEVLGKDCPVCLVEVDAPGPAHADTEIRQRRQNFYRRNGCLLLRDFSYILPLPGGDQPADMELMAFFPGEVKFVGRDNLEAWLRDIYTHVYGCRPDDPRIRVMMDRFRGNPEFL